MNFRLFCGHQRGYHAVQELGSRLLEWLPPNRRGWRWISRCADRPSILRQLSPTRGHHPPTNTYIYIAAAAALLNFSLVSMAAVWFRRHYSWNGGLRHLLSRSMTWSSEISLPSGIEILILGLSTLGDGDIALWRLKMMPPATPG